VSTGAPLILVADDDASIREALERELRLEGFAVQTASGGRRALELIAREPPAAIVLDVVMPDLNGRAVCARLRADNVRTPVLMLSAADEVEDRIAGLQAGADDYLVKPFAVSELVARLHALLRRAGEPDEAPRETLTVGDLTIDPAARVARRGDRELTLTRREFELLEVLARNAGVVLSRQRLLELVWGYDWAADANVVDVFVSYLRRKLEADGEERILQTVRGIGFRLRPVGGQDARRPSQKGRPEEGPG
jgi:DNA-binding response OmpR family regulator